MKRLRLVGLLLAAGALVAPARAGGLTAGGVISAKAVGSAFDYTITLTNSSGSVDSLGTFWFAWVPGDDFMPTNPIAGDFVTPAGWKEKVTNGGPTDGYAIQWVSGSAATDLAPGGSLTFGFASSSTPAAIAGDSPFYPTFPVTTSFVYQGAPFVGASDQFVVSFASVPEPSTLMLGGVAVVASIAYAAAKRYRSRSALA